MTRLRFSVKRTRDGSFARLAATLSACVALAGVATPNVAAQIFVDGKSTVIVAGDERDATEAEARQESESDGGVSVPELGAPGNAPVGIALVAADESIATEARAATVLAGAPPSRRTGYGPAALGYAPATSARIITRASAFAPPSYALAPSQAGFRPGPSAFEIDPWYARRYHVNWRGYRGRRYDRAPGYIIGYGFDGPCWRGPIGFHGGFLWNFPGCASSRGLNLVHCR